MRTHFVLLLFLLLAAPCLAHHVVEEDGDYVVTHEWRNGDRQWSCTLTLSTELYRYYQGRGHLSETMVEFVLSDYDRACLRSLVRSFREGGDQADYTDADNLRNVVSFVQSLRYVTDLESTGADDYVRFPVETLVDGEGDCEDLAILAAAILHEMGYDVMLALLPDHMALALNCGFECDGVYYEYEGCRYYYLEVTDLGWTIGQIPAPYRTSRATLVPLDYRPTVRLRRSSYRHDAYYSTDREVPFVVECELENAGPGPTDGLSARVVFSTYHGRQVLNKVFPLEKLTEGEASTYELRFNVPRPFQGRIEVFVDGDNFDADTIRFDEVELQ